MQPRTAAMTDEEIYAEVHRLLPPSYFYGGTVPMSTAAKLKRGELVLPVYGSPAWKALSEDERQAIRELARGF